jgi:Glycosyl hydrolase family 3 C-terminal domain/Fibronectin type III-like domain
MLFDSLPSISQGQYELVAALREASPDTKIILVYFGGRPRLLSDIVPDVNAVFIGFLPGPYAGTALANLISGHDISTGKHIQPSARLPVTYPFHEDIRGVPYLHSVSDQCTRDTGGTLPHWEIEPCQVQWSFGHGLSYSEFSYSSVAVNKKALRQRWTKENSDESALEVSVTVQNEGDMAGSHSILVFSFDESRSVTPEYRRLRAFKKIWLKPGASQVVSVPIYLDDLRFVGPHDDTHYILQDGLVFRIGIGSSTDCRSDPNNSLCSEPITIHTEKDYVAACEAACDLWEDSGCHAMTADTCRSKCSGIHEDQTSSLNNDGWGWTYVSCLEAVILNDSFHPRSDCDKLQTLCRDVLSTSSVDEFGLGRGSGNFGSTEIQPWALALALFAGVFASAMILFAMNGGCSTRKIEHTSDVQFSAISTSEAEFS